MPEIAIKKWFNPKVLKWARERMRLEPHQIEELSKKKGLEIKAEDLVRWESGIAEPQLSDLEVISAIYACPVGYFTLDLPPKEEMPLNFRGLFADKVQLLSYESRLQLRKFISFTDYISVLARQLDARGAGIRKYTVDDSIQTTANKEREQLGLSISARAKIGYPQGFFELCRKQLENLGIYILSLKLNPREVRGASRWDPPGPPSILVNDADAESASGRTFTLLHEYAHLLMRQPGFICDFRGGDEKIEVICNKFAAEVLVPREEFIQNLEKEGLLYKREWWGDSSLDRIRKPFLASRNVVAILLEETGLAPAGFYFEKARIWDSQRVFFGRSKLGAGHRRTKLQLMRNKLGESLTSIIVAGNNRGIVSSFDLAELLDSRIEKVDEFISWAKTS